MIRAQLYMTRFYLLIWLFFCLSPQFLLAQDLANVSSLEAENAQKELLDVKTEIDKERSRIVLLESKEQELSKEAELANKELDKLVSEKNNVQTGLAKVDVRISIIQKAISRVEEQISEFNKVAFDRIVASYKMHRKLHLFDYLFGANNVLDVYQRGRFLEIIVRKDRERLNKLIKLVEELITERKQYQEAQSAKTSKLNELTSLSNQLEKRRYAYGILLSTLKEQREQRQQTVEKLIESAKRLQKVLDGIMGDKQAFDTNGMGLESLYGKLQMPVSGKIVRRFGAQRHDEFSEMLYIKGIEFVTTVGAKVEAIASGIVIFSQVVPEYGNVVIVDHGKRYYTLYGRLASSLVTVGRKVEKGDTLAILGETDDRGANFYFELRVRGKAVDPWNYFAATS